MKLEHDWPGLCRERTAAGHTRWRVRAEGRKAVRITLAVAPGHPAFRDHYLAARAGRKLEMKAAAQPGLGTFDELAERYGAAMDRLVAAGKLNPKTRESRRRALAQACAARDKRGRRMGELRADMPKAAFLHIVDDYGARTGAADTCLKGLRAAYTWAADQGIIPTRSPVHDVPSPHQPRGGATTWTAADEAQFLAAHPAGTMARRWFWLARDTAGRIGDMHRLGPQHRGPVEGKDCLSWQPSKRGSSPALAVISPEFATEIAGHTDPAYLLTDAGRPFASSGALDNRVRKWIMAAKLTDTGTVKGKAKLSQHGIRKREATTLAEAGGTAHEIAARLGHGDTRTSAAYLREVNRKRLALAGIDKVRPAIETQSVPTPSERGTHAAEKTNKTREKLGEWQPVGESNPSSQVENLVS